MTKPLFIIVAGCAGAGKTTLGKEIAKKLDFAFVDKDTVCGDFTDFILTKTGGSAAERESKLYKNEVRPMEYLSTFKVCKDILDCGKGVVLAIPFVKEIQHYDMWEDICSAVGLDENNLLVVWIEHNEAREHRNILKRNSPRDDYKLEHWSEYCKTVEKIVIDRRYAVVKHKTR